MNVAAMMSTNVRTATPDSTLAQVVGWLADGHVSALAVVDGHGRLVGVVSTTDVLRAQAESPADVDTWRDARAGEVMNHPAFMIGPEMDVRDAARRMLQAEVHQLFVEADGRLLGVVSQWDLVRSLADGTG
jgi:CBS domain-containing protein